MTVLTIIFVLVVISAWTSAMRLRETIAAHNSAVNIDINALVEIEKMRNIAESQIASSRAFFLLGSTKLFDEQKKDHQMLSAALAKFQTQYSLPQIPEIIKRIEGLQHQQQEFFDQGMEFRAKQTESKIVGQFYQSKTVPIRDQINKAFNEIISVHNAELERARKQSENAASDAQVQIPKGMTWFTGMITLLFLGMIFLVLRMLSERTRHIAERNRLYQEAKRAVQARDELIVAISHDLNEPLAVISQTADFITSVQEPERISDGAELIKSSVTVTGGLIKDILDQSKADTGDMALRLDQLAIDSILEEARLMLQPSAKQRDVRLEFNSGNPPALAFFDRGRVLRVLSNLVGNAIKFSPKNSKVIVKARSDQQYVYISVKDSGPGIPEKQLSDLFDNFWQARKTAAQGPGIGLSIVKTIIEAHGGTVTVESHVGHGSTFTFSLPRRRPAGAHLGRPATSITAPYTTRTLPHHENRNSPSY